MFKLIEVLKMKVTNLREGKLSSQESFIEVLSYTKVEVLEKMFDYIENNIFDSIGTLKVLNKYSMKERIDETEEYLRKGMSDISDKKVKTYILCLVKSLNLKVDNIDDITEKIGSKLVYMSDEESSKFKRVLMNELLIPLKDKVAINLLSELCIDNTYSDICMLLLEYLVAPAEDITNDTDDSDEDGADKNLLDEDGDGDLEATEITEDVTDSKNDEKSIAIEEALKNFTLDELQEMVKRKKSSSNN